MNIFSEIRWHIGRLWLPTVLLFIISYTYYQMLTGDRGLMTWYHLNTNVEELKLQNSALTERKKIINTKVNRLYGKTLDPDYVDELARRNLPYMRPDEQMIIIGTD